MKTEKFSGHSSEMREDTPWLSSEDLDGRGDVKLVIDNVHYNKGIEFEGGRKEDKYSLAFRGKKKQLILNNTNRQMIRGMLGPYTEKWIGKEVTLYVRKGIKAFGKEVDGIRVRPR